MAASPPKDDIVICHAGELQGQLGEWLRADDGCKAWLEANEPSLAKSKVYKCVINLSKRVVSVYRFATGPDGTVRVMNGNIVRQWFDIPIVVDPPEWLAEWTEDKRWRPSMDGLTIGRMVHYVDPVRERHCAAVVVDVENFAEGQVDLFVFKYLEGGGETLLGISFDDDDRRPCTWHWIERA